MSAPSTLLLAPEAVAIPSPTYTPAASPASPVTMVPADSGDIDIWLTFYNEIDDERQLEGMRCLLSDAELAQERRFYFADDRKRYLVTRAMVRTALSRYAPVQPDAWTFTKNAYGRPAVAGAITAGVPLARDLTFNISHTRGLIALAITRGRELGVDVENLATRNVSLDIADRFFSTVEVHDLADTPEHAQQERFFEYWTFKESYIKARGMGLSLPLDAFSFEFPQHDAVRISIDPGLDDRADRWSFWQYRPSNEHLLAICAERLSDSPPAISLRRYVPLAGDMPVRLPSLRRSGVC